MTSTKFRRHSVLVRFTFLSFLLIAGISDLVYSQDDADEETEPLWNISSAGEYYSRYTSYGIDLSEGRSAFSIGSAITHRSGVSAGVELFALTGTNGGYEHSSFHVGYEFPIASFLHLSGVYTFHSYRSDSLNVLAGISNELSLGGTLTVSRFVLSAGFTTFFGGGNANYGTLGVSREFTAGTLSVTPSVQFSIASQAVDESLLPKNRGQSKKQGTATVTTTTISGLSNITASAVIRYTVGNGFAATILPAFLYSPTDLASSKSQFIITVGVEHSIDL